jgi:hypothetical protein
MKPFLLVFLLVASLTGYAQTPLAAPLPAAAPKIITTDDFKRALAKNAWTWEIAGEKPSKIEFMTNGTVRQTHFECRYSVKSPRVIELTLPNKQKARLTFDDEVKTYRGTDFNGFRPVTGVQQ